METQLPDRIERIEDLAQQVKDEREGAVQDLLTRLKRINDELVEIWEGPSQQAFYASYGDWISQLEDFSNTLHNVHQYLLSLSINLRDLEVANDQDIPSADDPEQRIGPKSSGS